MTGRRALSVVVVGLLAAAAALWGAGRAVGGDAEQPLAGLALLALAGVAGAVASAGLARRVIGALLVLSGVAAVASRVVPPVPAAAGCALLAAAGGVLLARGGGMPRLGGRYAAPGSRRPADPDLVAWRALDAGGDPTDDSRTSE